MFDLTLIGDAIILVGGIAIGVLYETKIKVWIVGAETFAANLRAKADAVAPAVTAAVNDIKKV